EYAGKVFRDDQGHPTQPRNGWRLDRFPLGLRTTPAGRAGKARLGTEPEHTMATHPLAGKPAPADMLIDVGCLEREYYERKPDVGDPRQLVSFGTSGHRGTTRDGTFTEAHILAITQAICEYRRGKGIDGPLFMGKDTHALSDAAQRTALEVLACNRVATRLQRDNGVPPTP